MGSGVAPQCSRNRCLARWTVRIPHRGRGGAAGRATRRKAWSRPRSEGLCPSRSRLRCRIPITASCIFGGADAGSSRRELAHETDRLDNLRGDLPALTGVLGVVGRIMTRCAGSGRVRRCPFRTTACWLAGTASVASCAGSAQRQPGRTRGRRACTTRGWSPQPEGYQYSDSSPNCGSVGCADVVLSPLHGAPRPPPIGAGG
jgi:hypothetical protein